MRANCPTGSGGIGLAAWECAIGLGLMTGLFLRATLLLLFLQMLGTLTPLFLFPGERIPYAPTLVAEPEIARRAAGYTSTAE